MSKLIDKELDEIYRMAPDCEPSIQAIKEQVEALELELQLVLDDWNSIRKISGAPANGTMIGFITKMRIEHSLMKDLLKGQD